MRNLAARGVESRVQQCLFRAGSARSADRLFDIPALRDFALRIVPLHANAIVRELAALVGQASSLTAQLPGFPA